MIYFFVTAAPGDMVFTAFLIQLVLITIASIFRINLHKKNNDLLKELLDIEKRKEHDNEM